MKNFLKLSYLLLALPFVAISCDDSDTYEPAPMPEGAQVYFSANNATSKTLSSTANSFTVGINRIETATAVSVPLMVTGDGASYFEVPSTVSFAAGEASANIVVGYDPEKLGFDNSQSFTLAIADESLTTLYGNKTVTIQAIIPAPWTTIGAGVMNENWWNGYTHKVNIQQNDIDKNVFRVVNPFPASAGYEDGDAYFQFKVYKAGETLMGETLTQDVVEYDDVPMTYYANYDAVINCCFPGSFKSLATQDKWTHNTVLAYQDNGLPGLVQIAPYFYMDGVGGWNKTQADDIITITFPGYEVLDFSISVEYVGKFIDPEGAIYVVSEIELGADVAVAKAVVVPTAEIANAVNGLVDGSIEGVEVENGSNNIPFEATADVESYTIVVVTFDANGEAQEAEIAEVK